MFQQIINNMSLHPKQLFLFDGFGALLSAFLLGVVLVKFKTVFGIPETTLYFLAFLPCVFACYDLYCYLRVGERIGVFLKGIGVANLVYCCLSLGLAFYHRHTVSYLGWGYILLEVAVIMMLVNIEMKTAAILESGK